MLIGASRFDHSDQLPNLPSVRNNLADLRSVLTDPITGIFSEDHCAVIEEPRTQADIVRPLKRLAEQAEDLLLVYYSGHGVQHPIRDELYLAIGSTDREILSVSSVAFENIREAFGNSPARTKLLILDCCYSGMAVGAMSAATLSPREVQVQGTSVIASSPKNKSSYAPPGDRYTAFSAELIRLLKDGPNIGSLPLTVQALFNGLRAAMANRNMPSPQLSSGNTSGELLLRKAPPPKIEVRLPRHSIPKPKPVRMSATPLGPVEPVVERRSGSLSDQPTVPALPPVAFRPVGNVGTVRPGGFAAPVVRPKVSRVGLFLLWVAFLFCADFAVAGFVGFAFGRLPNGVRSAGDLGAGISGLVLGVGLGLILRWRLARRRALGSAAQMSRLPKVPSWVPVSLLIVIGLFCVVSGVGVIATWNQGATPADQLSAASPSTTTSGTTLMLWLAEGAFASGRVVFRRFRPVRPDQRVG